MSTTSGQTFSAGQVEVVSSGNTFTNDTFGSGSTLTVNSGGVETSGTFANGSILIVSGGTASGDSISGTVSTISGVTASLINETVYAGGIISGSNSTSATNTALSGGELLISGKGGTYGTTTVTNGGSIVLDSPKAYLSGSIDFTGAGAIVYSAAVLATSASSSFGDQAIISGFGAGDDIDLATVASNSTVYLTSATSGTTETITVMSGGTVTGGVGTGGSAVEAFLFASGTRLGLGSDASGNAEVVACYAEGTRILTEDGGIAIERLSIGDRVATVDGEMKPIRWIGRRRYSGRALSGRKHVLPIRIKAGALTENTPRRDLVVSPMHAMLIDGVLVPAWTLINGETIVREHVESISYVHIELDRHEAIWAEGAASETFVDDDSRFIFQTSEGEPATQGGQAEYCAPRVEHGHELQAIRDRIAYRAKLLTA